MNTRKAILAHGRAADPWHRASIRIAVGSALLLAPGCRSGEAGTVGQGAAHLELANDQGPCADQTCSGHGSCAPVARCDCDAGYHDVGLSCIEDGDSPCAGQTCSGHGSCAIVDASQAKCECDAGYHAVGLSCVEDGGRQELRGVPAFPLDRFQTPESGSLSVGARRCVGTEESPATIVGGTWKGKWSITAQWCIIADVETTSGRIAFQSGSHHVSVRNATIGNQGSQMGLALSGDWMQVRNSHVHHNTGPDKPGVGAGCGSTNIFVINNLIEYNGGDGFIAGHRCKSNPIRNVFFAGNTLNNNRENGFDCKGMENIVVSGNHFRGHRAAAANEPYTFDDGTQAAIASSGSDGASVVLGSDDYVGSTHHVFLFDNIYTDNDKAVRFEYVHDESWVWGDHVLDSRREAYKFDKKSSTTFLDTEISNSSCGFRMGWRDDVTAYIGADVSLHDVGERICATGSRVVGTIVDPTERTTADLEADFRAVFGWSL